MGKRAAARAWKSKEPKARGRYIYTHCCCDAKQSFQGLFSSTTIMTTPDLTSTPKFKLWSYIVVVAQMRWTTTKLQKDEEEENRDERRRRGNVHGDFQLYYTRHMCCCMLLLFFLDDMETSICIENVSIFDCFFKKLNIAQFRYKMMFPCRLHKRTLEQQQHAVAHVSRTLNETIMKILDVVVCYVVGDTHSCYLPSCNIAW